MSPTSACLRRRIKSVGYETNFRGATLAACAVAAAARRLSRPTVFRAGQDVGPRVRDGADRDGRLVTTLTKDALRGRDEGKPQPITQFDKSPQPIRLVVMRDVQAA